MIFRLRQALGDDLSGGGELRRSAVYLGDGFAQFSQAFALPECGGDRVVCMLWSAELARCISSLSPGIGSMSAPSGALAKRTMLSVRAPHGTHDEAVDCEIYHRPDDDRGQSARRSKIVREKSSSAAFSAMLGNNHLHLLVLGQRRRKEDAKEAAIGREHVPEGAGDGGKACFLPKIDGYEVGADIDGRRQDDAAEVLLLNRHGDDLRAGEKLDGKLVADPAIGRSFHSQGCDLGGPPSCSSQLVRYRADQHRIDQELGKGRSRQ